MQRQHACGAIKPEVQMKQCQQWLTLCVSVCVCEFCVCVCAEWVMPAIDEAFAQIPLILFTRFFRCCCSCCAEVARWTCNTLQHTATLQHIMGLMKTGEKRMKNNRTWTNTCHPFQLKFIARGKANTEGGIGRGWGKKKGISWARERNAR